MMSPSKVRISSKQLVLRSFSITDANDIIDCITPSLTRFMSWDAPNSKSAYSKIWKTWLTSQSDGSDLNLVIRNRSNNVFLGIVGLHHLPTSQPELGIWISQDFQNRGYGSEAVTTVISWATLRFKPSGFLYPVAEENIASRRLVESMGGVLIERRVERKYVSVVYFISPK